MRQTRATEMLTFKDTLAPILRGATPEILGRQHAGAVVRSIADLSVTLVSVGNNSESHSADRLVLLETYSDIRPTVFVAVHERKFAAFKASVF